MTKTKRQCETEGCEREPHNANVRVCGPCLIAYDTGYFDGLASENDGEVHYSV